MSETCQCQCGNTATAPDRAPITGATTVAEVSRRFPGAAEVLKQLGLDHCCGGGLPLDVAAASAGVPLATLLARLREVTGAAA